MKEIWKDIENYEGLYQVSNLGKIKSLEHDRKADKGSYTQKSRIMKSFIVRGYYQVRLYKDRKYKNFSIHRLVAQAFIPNLENKAQVNHINGIKTDNRMENLEWCTQSENMIHAYKTGLQKPILGGKNVLAKAVAQYDKTGKLIKEYQSTMEAERETGISHSNISSCCSNKGRYKTVGGYVWKYVNI